MIVFQALSDLVRVHSLPWTVERNDEDTVIMRVQRSCELMPVTIDLVSVRLFEKRFGNILGHQILNCWFELGDGTGRM